MDEIEQVIYRMDEEMRLQGRSDSVRNNYKRYAGWFLRQAGKPVADLGEADIRAYLQTLMGRDLTPGTINMYNAAIRFLFEVTLDRVLHKKQIPRMKEDSSLPDILSKEEPPSQAPGRFLFLNRDKTSHAHPRALQKAFSTGLERAGIQSGKKALYQTKQR